MAGKILRLAVWGLIVLVLQLVLAPLLMIKGIRPDLLTIFVVFIALRQGSYAGLVAGFCAGLAQDLLSVGLIGVMALAKSSVAFWLGRWAEAREALPGSFTCLIIIFLATLVQDFIVSIFILQGSNINLWGYLIVNVFPTAAYSGIVGYLWALAPIGRIAPEKQLIGRAKRIPKMRDPW